MELDQTDQRKYGQDFPEIEHRGPEFVPLT